MDDDLVELSFPCRLKPTSKKPWCNKNYTIEIKKNFSDEIYNLFRKSIDEYHCKKCCIQYQKKFETILPDFVFDIEYCSRINYRLSVCHTCGAKLQTILQFDMDCGLIITEDEWKKCNQCLKDMFEIETEFRVSTDCSRRDYHDDEMLQWVKFL